MVSLRTFEKKVPKIEKVFLVSNWIYTCFFGREYGAYRFCWDSGLVVKSVKIASYSDWFNYLLGSGHFRRIFFLRAGIEMINSYRLLKLIKNSYANHKLWSSCAFNDNFELVFWWACVKLLYLSPMCGSRLLVCCICLDILLNVLCINNILSICMTTHADSILTN